MRFLFFISCVIIVISCTPQLEFEDRMYNCTQQSYQKLDVNLDDIVTNFENYLIENKYLKNSSPQSYLQLRDSIVQSNSYPITLPKELTSSMVRVNLINQCLGNITDSTELKQSRLFELTQQMKELLGSIDSQEFNPGLMNKKLLSTFKGDDFRHKLYKLVYFNLVNAYYFDLRQRNRGVVLPSWVQEESNSTGLKERNVFSVFVKAQDELVVREKPMLLKDLKEKVKEFIANPQNQPDLAASPANAIISLKNERDAKYEFYLKVLNTIKLAYQELRDEEAMKRYHLTYDDLDKIKQKEINILIPMVISEAEPTAFGEEE